MIKQSHQLIGINEIAEYLGVKVSTIYAWVHSRQIPYYKIGRLVKFKAMEIDEWIESKRVEKVDFN